MSRKFYFVNKGTYFSLQDSSFRPFKWQLFTSRICHKRKLDVYSSTDDSGNFLQNQWIKSLKTNQLRAQNATLLTGISSWPLANEIKILLINFNNNLASIYKLHDWKSYQFKIDLFMGHGLSNWESKWNNSCKKV